MKGRGRRRRSRDGRREEEIRVKRSACRTREKSEEGREEEEGRITFGIFVCVSW